MASKLYSDGVKWEIGGVAIHDPETGYPMAKLCVTLSIAGPKSDEAFPATFHRFLLPLSFAEMLGHSIMTECAKFRAEFDAERAAKGEDPAPLWGDQIFRQGEGG